MQFDESKHPRADDGKFTDGNGTGKKAYDSQEFESIVILRKHYPKAGRCFFIAKN